MYTWFDHFFGSFLVLFLVGCLIGVFFVAKAESEERERLTAQCLSDGRKEYECASMIKDDSVNTMVLPVVIGR